MLSPARRAWTHFEPIHAVAYFAPEARAQFQAAGLRGGWMGYFASRSAPMGAVGPEVVAAVFHNFHPAMVARAIPDAWRYSSPEAVLSARLAGVDGVLTRFWGEDVQSPEVAEAAELALDAASYLRPHGRPLFAGHAGLAVPAAPHLALWHACTLLREHRFDGHIAALTAHGLDGLDALITAVATGKGWDAAAMRGFRGWSEAEWRQGEDRLRERGLLDAAGELTPAGAALRAAMEETTDRLAAEPWERLEAGRHERLLTLLRGLAARVEGEGGFIYPNPVGVSRPAA